MYITEQPLQGSCLPEAWRTNDKFDKEKFVAWLTSAPPYVDSVKVQPNEFSDMDKQNG